MRAYLFPCSKANEGECGVVAELILGKGIVSKSSLSLHTQNFFDERWRHVGGEEAKSCPPCIPQPFLSCPHFISKKLLCKLQAKFLASQDSFHMVWGLRWDWEVCCPSAFTVNDRISAAALISFFLL